MKRHRALHQSSIRTKILIVLGLYAALWLALLSTTMKASTETYHQFGLKAEHFRQGSLVIQASQHPQQIHTAEKFVPLGLSYQVLQGTLRDLNIDFYLALFLITIISSYLLWFILQHFLTDPLSHFTSRLAHHPLTKSDSIHNDASKQIEFSLLQHTLDTMLRHIRFIEKANQKIQKSILQNKRVDIIGETAGGIAHDLRHFLGVILGYASLLEENITDPKHVTWLIRITNAVDLASSKAEALLAFARRGIINKSTVDLNALLIESTDWLNNNATPFKDNNQTIKLTLADDLADTLADPKQLKRALIELALNASQAMADNGTLRFATSNYLPDANHRKLHPAFTEQTYLHLKIEDNGCGIPEPNLEKIFEPFYSAESNGQHLGLGLVFIQTIIEYHAGIIEVDSTLNQGSIFNLYLPATTALPIENTTATTTQTAHPETLTNLNFLIADDQHDLSQLVEEILQHPSNHFYTVNNGLDLVACYLKHQKEIDLVITDVMMPGCSGIDAYQQLVTHNPKMKIIFMSGYTDNQLIPQDSKHIRFIKKPFNAKQLIEQIRSII